jgi:serine/threonine protein phosphatase PrpC
MASEAHAKVTLSAAMRTDVGVVREHNEDSAHVDSKFRFFIVADGMGGHAAGEVASAMAVQTVRETLEQASDEIATFAVNPDEDGRKEIVTLLETAVRAAHRAVFERGSRETDKQGMGTTLEVVLVAGNEAFIAHVGDSRTYLVRETRAVQITTDHTVAEVLVLEGKLSVEEAQMSPLRTILVNAIGVAPDVGIEMAHVQLHPGDEILLCSDGLHDYFPAEQEIADRLGSRDPDEALLELVELAKERGGHDNITGIVVHVVGPGGAPGAKARKATPGVPEVVLDEPLSDGVPAPLDEDPSIDADTHPVDVDDEKRRRGAQSATERATTDPGETGDAASETAADKSSDKATDKSSGKSGKPADKSGKPADKPANKMAGDAASADDDEDAHRVTQPMQSVTPPEDDA